MYKDILGRKHLNAGTRRGKLLKPHSPNVEINTLLDELTVMHQRYQDAEQEAQPYIKKLIDEINRDILKNRKRAGGTI